MTRWVQRLNSAAASGHTTRPCARENRGGGRERRTTRDDDRRARSARGGEERSRRCGAGRRTIVGLEAHLYTGRGPVRRRRTPSRRSPPSTASPRSRASRTGVGPSRAPQSTRGAEQQTEHRSGGRLVSGRARVRAERATTRESAWDGRGAGARVMRSAHPAPRFRPAREKPGARDTYPSAPQEIVTASSTGKMVLRACRLGVAAAFDRVSQRQIPFNVSRPRSLAGRESSQQTRGSQRIRNMRGADTRVAMWERP